MKASGGVTSSAGGMLGGILDIFQPGREHTIDQQDHERVARPRDDSDGPGPIDFKNSKINIKRRSAESD